jgi:putative ABC transport system permease protein
VMLFAAAVSLGTGVMFGLTPLAHVLKRNLLNSLKSAGSSTTGGANIQHFRQALVVGQLALALILLIGTGLMLRAFWKLQEVNAGFEARNVMTMFVALPGATYQPQQARDLWTRLETRLAALPGVESIGLASGLPPVYGSTFSDTRIEGYVPTPGSPVQNVQFYQSVSKGYFNALRLRFVEGRAFDERDGQDAPEVAIINQTMARTFWGNDSPVGRRIRPGGTTNWCTVIGVVADAKNDGLEKPAGTELYLPLQQTAGRRGLWGQNVVLRAPGNPAALVSAVRRELAAIDPALPITRIRPMEEVLAAARSRPQFLTLLLTAFAGVALVLAAVGIYGVISYSVARRAKEIGLRMALGAQRGNVLGLILGGGLRLTVAGLLFGLTGALALTRFLSTLLFGVTPTDPVTFASVSLLLAVVAVVATYSPARRASRVDPMVALRNE